MNDRLNQLESLGITTPYAFETEGNISTSQARILAEKQERSKSVRVVGRITSIRKHGKVIFYDLEDQEGKIQLIISAKKLDTQMASFLQSGIAPYDLIEVSGVSLLSKSGEPSIMVSTGKMVAPCLHSLDKITDVNLRFAKRTQDMIVNPDVKKRLILRSKILYHTRSILEKHGFLETTTPLLQGKYGGGKSTPFTSYCNSLDSEMFLRATMDLYLKRMVAGGIERVYEIGKCFRNEGICSQYNPEFLMLEAYGAYMPSSEMINVVQEIVNTGLISVQSTFPEIWGTKPLAWNKEDYTVASEKYLGINVSNFKDLSGIKAQCENKGFDMSTIHNLSDLHNKLAEVFLGKKFIEPTILTGLPVETSPLMRRSKENPDVLDRAWFFTNGIMFCDLAGELSDPTEQLNRLKEQKKDLLHSYDNVDNRHIEALQLGCPFLSGIGFGFDRFLLGITKADHIRENIPFPIAYETIKKDPKIITSQKNSGDLIVRDGAREITD